jgi:hypothetical protein
MSGSAVIGDRNFVLYDAPLWNMALIASRLHWVWISAVCVRLEMRFSYSNTLGWNTFSVPTLTEKNKADLTRCAEDILLAREAHFPATIADLYDPDNTPADLREAHERNDEVLSASISAAGSATTPSGWKSCSSSTRQCPVTRKVLVIGRV